LSDAAHQTSETESGSFKQSGVTGIFLLGFDSEFQGGSFTFPGIGSADLIAPNAGNYSYVKASSLSILKNVFEVKEPTSSEIGIWYKVTKSDPRYNFINPPGGADTIAQAFSYSPVGWSRAATYDGTTTLRGVRVFKLSAASNIWVEKGFGKLVLYVTDNSHPLPFATTGPPGSTGLCYFSKWGSTRVVVPTPATSLPR
jgi:hypothetical protein